MVIFWIKLILEVKCKVFPFRLYVCCEREKGKGYSEGFDLRTGRVLVLFTEMRKTG